MASKEPTINIELTTVCNYKCKMCPYPILNQDRNYIDMDLVEAILEQSKIFKNVHFNWSGLGEPMLHKQFIDIHRKTKEYLPNSTTGTNSNASYLHKFDADEIVESGVDWFVFSVNAGTQESFKWLNGVNLYDKVITNVVEFLKQRNKNKKFLQTGKPTILINLFDTEQTAFALEDFKEFWKPYFRNNDRVWFRNSIENWGGVVDIKQFGKERDVELINSKRFPCTELWGGFSIRCDGAIVPCDIAQRVPEANKDELVYGYVQNEGLQNSFFSENAQKIRNIHLNGEFDRLKHCQNCTSWTWQENVFKRRLMSRVFGKMGNGTKWY